MMDRTLKRACVVGLIAIVAGVLVPSGAVAKKCSAYKPAPPSSASANAEEAPSIKAHKVTDKATEKKPVTIEFAQEPGLWNPDGSEPIVDTSQFHNFQFESKKSSFLVHIRAEWMYPTASDLDFYLFNEDGIEVTSSATFSPFPPLNPGTGGEGFELMETGAANCTGFTLESRPYISPTGEAVTLKVWID
jgi:hypothetical protein